MSKESEEKVMVKPKGEATKKKKDEDGDAWDDPTIINEDDLSEEDLALKHKIDDLVMRVIEARSELAKLEGGPDDIRLAALGHTKTVIQSATSSITSVPKPLKFLRPHWLPLVAFYATMAEHASKKELADILSCLSMTMAEEGSKDSLRYILMGSSAPIGDWGHEYIRNLTGEIGQEFLLREADNVADLMKLVDEVLPFHVKHNAEVEACDLLMEVDRLPDILKYADETNFTRIGIYLQSCASYLPEPEDTQVLKTACTMYRHVKKFPEAMRMALRLNESELIAEIYNECEDGLEKKQLALILGRQQLLVEDEDEEQQELMFNSRLSEHFLGLAGDLEVLEPKTPEDVYKDKLASAGGGSSVDSARANLAATFVNAFVNVGFAKDKLMQVGEQEDEAGEGGAADSKWLFKNKDSGMMSAAASVGMLVLWDIDQGLNEIDRYLHDDDTHIKAGALLAMGLVHSGVRHDCDPAKALLSEYLGAKSESGAANPETVRIAAIAGLGLAYAGTARDDVLEDLLPNLSDDKAGPDVLAITSLAIGMVYVGSCNKELSDAMVAVLLANQLAPEAQPEAEAGPQSTAAKKKAKSEAAARAKLEEKRDKEQASPLWRFLALGTGMLYLGKKQAVDGVMEQLATMAGPMAEYCRLTVETTAYTGSGDVDKVHKLLAVCGEHPPPEVVDEEDTEAGEKKPEEEEEKRKAVEAQYAHQFVSTVGLSLVSMSEDVGSGMLSRTMGHLLQYGEINVRRAVPLALGVLNLSNPELTVTETLSKLTHDADPDVAMSAMLSLGLVSAGTNNSRVAGMLRNLASYYAREPNHLFILRIAQGLLHMGKGLVGINPYHSEGSIMSPVAVCGLLVVLHACADMKGLLLGKWHWLLYYLVTSIYPRMLITVGEDMQPIPVSVRVGQAVDTVGQAGKPKSITGFQTHTSPVLLAHGERAELATDEYIPVSSLLAGIVILKENPDYVKEEP